MKQDVQSPDNVGSSPALAPEKVGWVKKQLNRLKAWCDKLTPEERKRLTFISMGVYIALFLIVITISIIN
ncbi:hypothetical protein [uncultured Porphyromonas sp.]|uniref:hypothetical protein n=1 Tax=uncultured Porphyromonas sp. TaxID=159274 RepID=UPI00262125B9|nr:hypothetical protein [uncultured Porphyromonas sp.]